MVAWFSGCVIRAIPTERGLLSAEEVVRNLRPVNPYSAPTGAVAIEQTHNMAGGTEYPKRPPRERCHAAHQSGPPVPPYSAPALTDTPPPLNLPAAKPPTSPSPLVLLS